MTLVEHAFARARNRVSWGFITRSSVRASFRRAANVALRLGVSTTFLFATTFTGPIAVATADTHGRTITSSQPGGITPSAADTPTVVTAAVSAVTSTTATCGGNVTSSGSTTVTARGVCWSTSASPTVAASHTTDSTGTGSFVSSITGLSGNHRYYVRAYATNSVGTVYGN